MEYLEIYRILKLQQCLKIHQYYKQIKSHLNIKMVSFIRDLLKINYHMEKDLLLINKVNLKLEYFKMENLFNSLIKINTNKINYKNNIIKINYKNNQILINNDKKYNKKVKINNKINR